MNWSKIANKYIGKPYVFGKSDCYTFLCSILEDQGYKIDYNQKIGIFDNSNYMEISDHQLLMNLMNEWICSNTDIIEPKEAKIGDIVMCKIKTDIFPCVLSSNGQVIACIQNEGIRVLNHIKIKLYRRWRNNNGS